MRETKGDKREAKADKRKTRERNKERREDNKQTKSDKTEKREAKGDKMEMFVWTCFTRGDGPKFNSHPKRRHRPPKHMRIDIICQKVGHIHIYIEYNYIELYTNTTSNYIEYTYIEVYSIAYMICRNILHHDARRRIQLKISGEHHTISTQL